MGNEPFSGDISDADRRELAGRAAAVLAESVKPRYAAPGIEFTESRNREDDAIDIMGAVRGVSRADVSRGTVAAWDRIFSSVAGGSA